MSRHVLDLGTFTWQMGQVPRQPFSVAPADDQDQVKEWLPARVPGDVRADLIANGRIPPVETLEGIAAGTWVDDCDWWYRTRLPAREASQVAVLEADGIDYYGAIWVDGTCLGAHAGMFGRQAITLPITDECELSIRVWGSGALPQNSRWRRIRGCVLDLLHPGLSHLSDRMAVPKAQFGFGWDFAPRLLSSGIWDDIRLVVTRGAYIDDLWAHAEPLVPGADPSPVRWHLRLRITHWQPGTARAQIAIAPANFDGGGSRTLYGTLDLCSGSEFPCTEDYELELEMAQGRRWWPWDQGEPLLYMVSVVLFDGEGVLDEISQTAGIRTVLREKLPGGAPWRFVVNERPLFLRGANWVPADMLPGRVTKADYDRLLGQAKAAGVNLLRVWGGGLREKQAFWDACDQAGLMAWHEFPLACDFFDRYPTGQAYMEPLANEAAGIVRALRGHPSLIAWCGGNEIEVDREARVLRVLAEQQENGDGTRPWIPASPSDGDQHQWGTWHGLLPWADLAETNLPFMSEFGFQAPPNEATLAEMFPGGLPSSWKDRRWNNRKAQTSKLLYYAAGIGNSPLEAAAAMQRVQATALQVGIEACRLRRDSCGGVAFWQFNEPWPAVSWSIVDYAGRAKEAYAAVKRCYQPVLVAARFPWRRYREGDCLEAEIWVVNDGQEPRSNCLLQAELDGVRILTQTGIDVPAAGVRQVGQLRQRLTSQPQHLMLQLWQPGTEEGNVNLTLAKNCYDLDVPLPGRQPLTARMGRWLAGWARRMA